jgi:hypothetical protein
MVSVFVKKQIGKMWCLLSTRTRKVFYLLIFKYTILIWRDGTTAVSFRAVTVPDLKFHDGLVAHGPRMQPAGV